MPFACGFVDSNQTGTLFAFASFKNGSNMAVTAPRNGSAQVLFGCLVSSPFSARSGSLPSRFRSQCRRSPSFSARRALKKFRYSVTPSGKFAAGGAFFSTPGGKLYRKVRTIQDRNIDWSYNKATTAQSYDSTSTAPPSKRGRMKASQCFFLDSSVRILGCSGFDSRPMNR